MIIFSRCSVATALAAAALLVGAVVVAGPAGAAAVHPTVTGMSAHSSGLAGAATVTVHGTHLKTTHRVALASGTAGFHVVSDSTVQVHVPRATRDLVTHVYLYTSYGRTAAGVHSQWTYIAPPTVTRLGAVAGPLAGGTRVTVTGHDFVAVRGVAFGASAARIVSRSGSTSLTVDAPRHAAGAVDVRVTTTYGTSRTGVRFSYAAAPTVSSVPTFVSQAGGPVSVQGTHLDNVRAITVDGRSARLTSSGSGGASVQFVAPAHAPGLVPVLITTAGGSVGTHVLYESIRAVDVTSSRDIDYYHGRIVGLSCPSTTFCMAVDDADAVTFDGVSWSKPVPTGRVFLSDVSCASADFCVAVGRQGGAIFDGTSWTPTDSGIDEPIGISCPVVGQCVEAGRPGTAVLNDKTWQALSSWPRTSDGKISCRSLTFCMSMGDSSEYLFDGTTWNESTVAAVDGTQAADLEDVSCSSSIDCTAVTLYGALWRYHGGTWSLAQSMPRSVGGWRSIACGGADSCVVSDGVNTVVDTDAAATGSEVSFHKSYNVTTVGLPVSCASATFCVAASGWGEVAQSDGTTWTAPTTVVQPIGYLTSVACVSSTECFAAGTYGTVVPYDGATWSEPQQVDPWRLGSGIVTCAASGLCATISTKGDYQDYGDGVAAVLSGGTWHPTHTGLLDAVALSCGGTRCMAVSATRYSTYDAAAGTPAWTAPAPLPDAGPAPGGSAVSVACASAGDCVVTFGSGSSHFDGHTWSPVGVIAAGERTGLVACAASGMCLARNSGFSVLRAANGSWGAPVQTAGSSSYGDVAESCGGSTCVSLSRGGFQIYANGIWTTQQTIPEQVFYLVGAATAPDGTILIVRSDGTVYRITAASGA